MKVIEKVNLEKQGISEPELDAFHKWAEEKDLL